MKTLYPLLKTTDSLGLLILRLTVGAVFLPHGLQKTVGAFGGHGFAATMGMFTDKMHIPAFFAFLAIVAESAGAVGMILGLLTRVAAFGLTVTMAVAISLVTWKKGFIENEFQILAIGACLCLMIRGAGFLSIDRLILKSMNHRGDLAEIPVETV